MTRISGVTVVVQVRIQSYFSVKRSFNGCTLIAITNLYMLNVALNVNNLSFILGNMIIFVLGLRCGIYLIYLKDSYIPNTPYFYKFSAAEFNTDNNCLDTDE